MPRRSLQEPIKPLNLRCNHDDKKRFCKRAESSYQLSGTGLLGIDSQNLQRPRGAQGCRHHCCSTLSGEGGWDISPGKGSREPKKPSVQESAPAPAPAPSPSPPSTLKAAKTSSKLIRLGMQGNRRTSSSHVHRSRYAPAKLCANSPALGHLQKYLETNRRKPSVV